ncbi:MAG: hypothetical protein HC830_15495 [Bacteroidetes bacterium]|nr:hypothetical protein [Bacteroidota bacterium]
MAETGIRGFALTKDSVVLNPFLGIRFKSDSILSLLQKSRPLDSVQLVRLEILKSMINEK